MKWLKSRYKFLKEAKIRDVILDPQRKKVAKIWGESWLDLEEIQPTDKIEQGKWKLSEEDKIKVFEKFFGVNLKSVYNIFDSLPDEFVKVLNDSIDFDKLDEDQKIILTDFDIKKPTINQISILQDPIFKKISISETKSGEAIVRNPDGIPLFDDNNRPIKRKLEEDEIVYTNNLTNINTFIDDFNNVYQDKQIYINRNEFNRGDIPQISSMAKEDFSGGYDYVVPVDVFSMDLYLKIDHNPQDILNMSVSRFFSSCQQLYSTSGYNTSLLSNVFDPNSIPAFLVFDTPIYYKGNIASNQLPLCRMIIRNVDFMDEKSDLYFDRCYPDRMENVMNKIIETYTSNNNSYEGGYYVHAPDIPFGSDLSSPYMDRLSSRTKKFIGLNSKDIELSNDISWERYYISPNAKVKNMIISTPDLPQNFFETKFDLETLILRYLKIKDIEGFDNIKFKGIGFDKCYIDKSIIDDVKVINNDVKILKILSCHVEDKLDFSKFDKLEELHLVYSINSEDLIDSIKDLKLKKLVLSGDLMSDKENKKFINGLKQRGLKVEIKGPII